MKIIQVTSHVGDEASGPSYSVVRLAQTLGKTGGNVCLMSVENGLLPASSGFEHRVFPVSRHPSFLWRSPKLLKALRDTVEKDYVIHSHGMWRMPHIYPSWIAKEKSAPLVLSPRGTMSSWALANSPVKKRLFWAVLQKKAIEAASCIHATGNPEYYDIRRNGVEKPVCIIPNGIDIPELRNQHRLENTAANQGSKEILFLGRLHPVKGVDILIRAWAAISDSRPGWHLRIVGPSNSRYAKKLTDQIYSQRISRCFIDGPIYGNEKQQAYQSAQLYVLPSHSENFGMTVAESLANGTPVITTSNTPWAELDTKRCGWSIDLSQENLVHTLLEATALQEGELRKMGLRGREFMRECYSWDSVASQMNEVYSWLLEGAEIPECVRLD